MTPLSARDGLIVCCGENPGELCAKAAPQIAAGCPGLNLQFVMTEWLGEDQIPSAMVYWVMDATAGLQDIRTALRHGIPLVVPEESRVLTQACREGNCGLFYRNQEEAIACVICLVLNPGTRAALSENGRQFFKTWSSAARPGYGRRAMMP